MTVGEEPTISHKSGVHMPSLFGHEPRQYIREAIMTDNFSGHGVTDNGAPLIPSQAHLAPLILTVPGLGNSGPAHWQTRWEEERSDIQRVELGLWDRPQRNAWVNQLNLAIRNAGRPVILVAHSLGCHAVAWWAQMEQPAYGNPVVGALLVAPAEVDSHPADARVTAFHPTPIGLLPFPSVLVASRNDPYIHFERALRLGIFWGSTVVDAGNAGHINADSGLEDWVYGQRLLDRLIATAHGAPLDVPDYASDEGAEDYDETGDFLTGSLVHTHL